MFYGEYMKRLKKDVLIEENSIKKLSPYVNEGYDSYILLKFTDSYEHQQKFLDGKLYFNTSDYFMMCDEEGRGDVTEGNEWVIDPQSDGYQAANLRIINGNAIIEIVDYSTKLEDYQPGTIFSYSPAVNRKRKLISCYTLYIDSQNNRIQEIDERMGIEFGEFGILITDTLAFYTRLEEGIRKHKGLRNAQFGFVEYMDNAKKIGLTEYNSFLKQSEYSYQNEFRATFIDEESAPNEAVTIEVGYLRDIAYPLYKDGIKELFMKDGLLNYPKYIVTEEESY